MTSLTHLRRYAKKTDKAPDLTREERTFVNTYSIIWLVAAHIGRFSPFGRFRGPH
ncbi:MAG: hypothetical protein R3C05_30365 [Pirellulaceae bacterium]